MSKAPNQSEVPQRRPWLRAILLAGSGLLAATALCGIVGAVWIWAVDEDPPPKSAVSLAGTRWILDRNGPSTCLTLEYRAAPLSEAPGLHHQTVQVEWPPYLGGSRLARIDFATLIGHIALRQHTLCWS